MRDSSSEHAVSTHSALCGRSWLVLGGLLLLGLAILLLGSGWTPERTTRPVVAAEQPAGPVDRSPVDLVLTPDEKWLLTANQTSASVSLVRVATGEVVA